MAGQDVPIQQARNELLPDGSIRNTTITGKRDALQSSLEAVGGDLSKLGISDGVLDTDLVRLGVDIDGSLTGFGLPPGGANVELPPQLPANFPIPKLRGKYLLEAEANLIDLDAIDFLYFDQEIVFRPNFKVRLRFDKPVEVRVVGSGAGFETLPPDGNGGYVMELPVSADAASTLEVKQVEGGVTITPSYSISDNLFENNLDWLINSGIQGTVGQLVLGGAIVAIAGPIFTGVSDLDSFNFALGQFAPTFDNPIRIPAHDHFNLGGFGNPVAGSALSVSANRVGPTRTVTAPPTAGTTPGITPTPGGGEPTVTGTVSPPSTPTPTATPLPCLGDCDGDRSVSINELVLAVNIASGSSPVSECPAADRSRDGQVTVDEVVACVTSALVGCPR